MVELCMVRESRRYLRLVPATTYDEDLLRGLRTVEPFQVAITFTRTSKLNRWYRGLVARVAEGYGAHPDALHAELKFRAGLIQQIIALPRATANPNVSAIAVRLQSTAYPEMEDLKFSNYVDFAVETMCHDYMAHIRSRARQQQILEWVGHRPKLGAS